MAVNSRRAFTLVELLVVMAIVAILIGILIPAIQAVRAAAAKSACQNNLKQLGLAHHDYHGIHDHFPNGISVRSEPLRPFLAWTGRCLPHLEQENLWREIENAFSTDLNLNLFYGHEPHAKLLATPVRTFACPSDPRVPGPSFAHGVSVAFTSYLGVLGRDLFRTDGILYLDSQTKITQISDGTSNTLLIGERPPSPDQRFGWWYRGWGQNQDGSAEMLLGVHELNVTYPACSGQPARFQAGSFDDSCSVFHFWSPHAGGANFVFADGSVRFLRYTADPVMEALASRAGGEVVQLP